MPETCLVYIGLGSNIENPVRQLSVAFLELNELSETCLVAHSSLYQSAPMGPQDQPDYINAVAQLKTALIPTDLLDCLQYIEREHKRVRSRHWGERTLDLDILLYGDEKINSDRLTVPHPGMTKRNFVLYPLSELDSTITIPGKGALVDWVDRSSQRGLQRLTIESGAIKNNCNNK
ncbi:MAG: 2-amino-4-hydroxy-6-hydroxymethyldihydropteridine diphosphokinase [Gammaproteobacteria bacterium]